MLVFPLPFVYTQGSDAVGVNPIIRKSLSMVLLQTLGDWRSPYKLLRSFNTSGFLVLSCIVSKPGSCWV